MCQHNSEVEMQVGSIGIHSQCITGNPQGLDVPAQSRKTTLQQRVGRKVFRFEFQGTAGLIYCRLQLALISQDHSQLQMAIAIGRTELDRSLSFRKRLGPSSRSIQDERQESPGRRTRWI